MDFLVRLLETNAHTPRNFHFASVVNLIFLQLQPTVDPEYLGVQLIIAQCSPPASADAPVKNASGSVAKCSGNVIEWNMKKHRSTKGIAKNHPYVSSYRPTPSSPD
jgi:hypothetical protein